MQQIDVVAGWDEEAGVWYVDESNVPGLSAEAETVDDLFNKLVLLVPELLELNAHLFDAGEVKDRPFHLETHRTQRLRMVG